MTIPFVDLTATDLPILGADPHREYRLGIMGGTFDPIHNGHLVAAEQAKGTLDLDVVVFMPAGSPAFKQGKRVSSGEDRYAMTLLAVADNPDFRASRFEVDRPGVTYTADTLSYLRDLYPENVGLYFITGADAVLDIAKWHDSKRIAELATVVAATRPGYDLERAQTEIDASGMGFKVIYIEVPALAISSSYLRERVREGQSLRYLTRDTVIGYIDKRNIYLDDEYREANLHGPHA